MVSPQMRRMVHGTANTGLLILGLVYNDSSFARSNAAPFSLQVGPTRTRSSVQHCGMRSLEAFPPPRQALLRVVDTSRLADIFASFFL